MSESSQFLGLEKKKKTFEGIFPPKMARKIVEQQDVTATREFGDYLPLFDEFLKKNSRERAKTGKTERFLPHTRSLTKPFALIPLLYEQGKLDELLFSIFHAKKNIE